MNELQGLFPPDLYYSSRSLICHKLSLKCWVKHRRLGLKSKRNNLEEMRCISFLLCSLISPMPRTSAFDFFLFIFFFWCYMYLSLLSHIFCNVSRSLKVSFSFLYLRVNSDSTWVFPAAFTLLWPVTSKRQVILEILEPPRLGVTRHTFQFQS